MELRRQYSRTSVTRILLRDGTAYFVVLLALNLAQMLTFGKSGAAPVTRLVRLLPSVLVSRFLLNLRQLSRASETQYWSTVTFRVPSSFLGNIGEPLELTIENDDDNVDEEEDFREPVPACRSPTFNDASLSPSGLKSIFDSDKDMYQDSVPNIPEVYSPFDEEDEAAFYNTQ
ncbi:hypothetical protein PsYK624_011580 [Phanerochaete sordida]|uniref:Uncharacterized protein n=1 Tax=Phanerochaete sordida TaxID=48140 RepID=A0A9P3FYV0_9APHY|nr:hypothetical protein PsYK624_011580 [Phanerochaete sordida]